MEGVRGCRREGGREGASEGVREGEGGRVREGGREGGRKGAQVGVGGALHPLAPLWSYPLRIKKSVKHVWNLVPVEHTTHYSTDT